MAGDDPNSSAPEDNNNGNPYNDPNSSALEDNNNGNPYNDPFGDFGHFTEEELRNVMSDTNPDLLDLSFIQNSLPPPPPSPPPSPSPHPTQAMEVNETQLSQESSLSVSDLVTDDDFLGPAFDDDSTFSWDIFNIPSADINNNINDNVLGENIGNDNDNNVGESSSLEVSTRVFGCNNNPNFETGDGSTRPIPVIPPVTEGILLCTCCNFIRKLVHTTGQEMIRLDIHGGDDFFCHAILEAPHSGLNRHPQTLHFKGLRREDVIKFIEDYCSWKEACGFTLLYDSNSDFYQPMNRFANNNQPVLPNVDFPMPLAMRNEALGVPYVPQYVGLGDESNKSKKVKERRQTPLAAQRERTGKLTLKDVSMHFHLPMEEAARRLGLCPTVVKKICRKGGLHRWPHRKIKSLEKKISSLKSVLCTAEDAEVRARIEEEIERLQKEISDICSDALKNLP